MTPTTTPIPIFVVSLARAKERRDQISAHLKNLGIAFRLVDAVDGRELPEEERQQLVLPGLTIHPGAIGCYLSHLEIYRAMVAEGIPLAMVLEDDGRLNSRFAPVLASGSQSLDFDYCFLDSDDHNDRGPIYYDRDDSVAVAPGVVAHRLSAGPQTTHAYMITLRAARQRLDHAFPICRAIDLYDHLPYPIVFRAIVAPKMAWVSEHSLVSFTSQKSGTLDSVRGAWLRRHPAFYTLRDLLKLKPLRRRLKARALVRQGVLPSTGRWRPLPSGREVIF